MYMLYAGMTTLMLARYFIESTLERREFYRRTVAAWKVWLGI